ncbi:MAG: ABC transporter permease [Gammaproteobacteria bacterium]
MFSISRFVLLGWLLLAFVGLGLAAEATRVSLPTMLQSVGMDHGLAGLLGFDELGRSVLFRLLSGASTSLLVAVSVVAVSALVGTGIGMVSSYLGGWVDVVVVRVIDVFMAFPGILLAIALAGVLGPGLMNVVIALSVVGWVGFARLTRAQVLSLKTRDHVLAAKAMGVSSPAIVRRHLLPLLLAPLLVEITFGLSSVIVAEAGLSFLGLGVQPPEASWGQMIRDGSRFLLVAPHLLIVPTLALMSVVISVNLLGDGLRDRLDVRSR